jgi:putative toxin-antitoxin system antitoxin component (TIGR02293 family)
MPSAVLAQTPQPTAPAVQATSPAVLDQIVASARPDAPVMLTLANRDIVQFRAAILGRSSADRAQTAGVLLRQLASEAEAVQVGLRPVGNASFVTVSGRDVFVILPADVDELSGETLDTKAQATVERLQQAFALSTDEITTLVQIPTRTMTRRKVSGRLKADESDRVLRAVRLMQRATVLFNNDPAAAKTWMKTPQRGLGGAVPLDLAGTEVGAREVEDALGRIEDGVFA